MDALSARDPDIARLRAEIGDPPTRTREPGFATLLQIMTAQQISTKAAAAIWRRLEEAAGRTPDHHWLSEQTVDALRACGGWIPEDRARACLGYSGARPYARSGQPRNCQRRGDHRRDSRRCPGSAAGVRTSISCSRWDGPTCFRPATSRCRSRFGRCVDSSYGLLRRRCGRWWRNGRRGEVLVRCSYGTTIRPRRWR